MATVKIGERELEVWNRNAPGGLGHIKRVVTAEAALREAKAADAADRMADLVRSYLVDESVTVDWLLANLPADCGGILRACLEASGGKVAEPGEAKSP